MNPRDPEAFQGLDEKYERLPLAQIVASKTNPRTHFPEGYIAQLAESLREKGLIEPIIVRPLDVLKQIGRHPEAAARNGASYEIVAGECRFRAGKHAGLSHLPAIIRAYSDEQVLELQLIENLHRKDLTPLEQARGYRRLIDANPDKHSAETIATRIGMSPAWVWDRMKLNDLVPEAKQILEQERMTVGHAILIARLKPEDQKRTIATRNGGLFEPMLHGHLYDGDSDPKEPSGKYDDVKAVSIRELEAWIARHVRFDVAHMAKAQPLAFEHTAAVVEQATALPGRGQKVIAITFDHGPAEDAKDANERTYGVDSWRRADGTKKAPPRMSDAPVCEHSVLGVVTVGRDHYGKTMQVCIARDRCRVHWAKEIAAREKNAKLRESGKGKQAAKNETKSRDAANRKYAEEQAQRERKQKAWQAAVPAILEAGAAAVKKAKTSVLGEFVLSELVRHTNAREKAAKLLKPGKSADDYLRLGVLSVLAAEMNYYGAENTFAKQAKRFGVDVAAILKASAKDAK